MEEEFDGFGMEGVEDMEEGGGGGGDFEMDVEGDDSEGVEKKNGGEVRIWRAKVMIADDDDEKETFTFEQK
eukprot:2151350-Prymnesium_polylepis.1